MKIFAWMIVLLGLAASPVLADVPPPTMSSLGASPTVPGLGLMAQVVAPPGATSAVPQSDGTIVFTKSLIDQINEYLATFVALVVVGVVSLAAQKVLAWLGVKMNNDDKDRALALLQTFIKTQAGVVIAKLDGNAINASIDVKSPGIAEAANKVLARLPDEAAKVGATPEKLADMLVGEIGKLQASAPTVAPVITTPVVNIGEKK
jgi:uncharacterized membrane protein